MRTPLTGDPQGDLSPFEGQEIDFAPISRQQGSRRVLFGFVFDASLGQVETMDTMEMVEMVVLLDQELHKYSNRVSRLSI